MFNSTILDVAIGLVFSFAAVALFVSSINEAIATSLKWRHKQLLTGIKWLLNNTALVQQLYDHALINPLSDADSAAPATASLPFKDRYPAYIPSQNFAHAMTDIIGNIPQNFDALRNEVNAISDPQLRLVLQGFLVRSDQQITLFEQQVAIWFDDAMDRVAGFYKRKTQAATFIIGLAVAGALNVNACNIFVKLWDRQPLSQAITSPNFDKLIDRAKQIAGTNRAQAKEDGKTLLSASDGGRKAVAVSEKTDAGKPTDAKEPIGTSQQTTPVPTTIGSVAADKDAQAHSAKPEEILNDVLGTMRTLPIGWTRTYFDTLFPNELAAADRTKLIWNRALFIIGILITASAAVFGAPFWFDLLQQLIQIRGTGTKPLTKKQVISGDTKPTRTP